MKNFNDKITAKSLNLDYIADKAILFFASLSLFTFMAFAWTVTEASKVNAQNANQTCGGKDLIAHYAANDPAKLQQIEEEAAKIINGKSVFWKIEKEDVPTSYMLGTMHMADERIATLTGKRLEAFNNANLLIVENTESGDPAKAKAAIAKLQHLTMLKGENLADLVDAETLELLEPAITSRGIPFFIAKKLRPWLLATTISVPTCEIAAKESGKPVLDTLLIQKAKENNKEALGLETVEEQLSAIANLPREFHLQALKETLRLGDEATDVIETMKQLYIKGEIGKTQPLMRVVTPQTTNLEDNKRFEEELIIKRNKIMAERSAEHLAKGNVFLAVGALHLPGDTGLVKLLRTDGFTVTAVE